MADFLKGNDQIMMRRRSGFTMTEIVVVIGILGVLMSIILPVIAETRMKARVAQCTSNLRQIGQAMVMYDTEHDRTYENYPDRVTHLYALGYAPNIRIFVCPMDSTKATKSSITGRTTLKPVFSDSVPVDDKSDWAERRGFTSNGMPEQDCSYLYEFSTRTCQSWQRNPDTDLAEWVGDAYASQWLVTWHNEDQLFGVEPDANGVGGVKALDEIYWGMAGAEGFDYELVGADFDGIVWPGYPIMIDRDPYDSNGDGQSDGGTITWQEAKFAQLEHGDVYATGLAWPGERSVPEKWSDEPYWAVATYDAARQHGYPRTWMPIIRCFWHCNAKEVDYDDINDAEHVLNLAIDGNTFYSVPGWEQSAWKHGKISGIDPDY
jgi:prepilin-type N-terminal cleavage/methylation domain-containing protein